MHCHAGNGRTGITLACYKIFEKKISAEIARKEVSVGERKSCLKLRKQFSYCEEFEKFLEISRQNFFEKNKKDITIFKINEKILDIWNYKFHYFNYKNYIEYIPIFLLYIFDRIIEIKIEKKYETKSITNFLTNKEINKEEELIIEDLIKNINKYNWEEINKCLDIKILGKILFKWLDSSINYVLSPKDIELIDNNNYSLSYKKCKYSTQIIICCISKFINLINDNKNENNNNIKKFLDLFSSSLLGYSINKINNQNKMENINKLIGIINFIINNE